MVMLRSDVEKEPLLRACGTSGDCLLKSIACPNRKGGTATPVHERWPLSIHIHLCLNILLGLLASRPQQPLNTLSQIPSYRLLTGLLSDSCGGPRGSTGICIAGRGCGRQLPRAVYCPCLTSPALSSAVMYHSLQDPSAFEGGKRDTVSASSPRCWVSGGAEILPV